MLMFAIIRNTLFYKYTKTAARVVAAVAMNKNSNNTIQEDNRYAMYNASFRVIY